MFLQCPQISLLVTSDGIMPQARQLPARGAQTPGTRLVSLELDYHDQSCCDTRRFVEQRLLSLIHLSVTKESNANTSRADPPWMAPPTSSSPPPPWEPPVNPWDDPQNSVSNLNATGRVWAFPADPGESLCAYGTWIHTLHKKEKPHRYLE